MINSGVINGFAINGESGGASIIEDVTETAVITSIANTNPTYIANDTAAVITSTPYISVWSVLTETAVITNPEPVQILSDLVTETAAIAATAYASTTRTQDVIDAAVVVSSVNNSATTVLDMLETAPIISTVYQPIPTVDVLESAVITSDTFFTAAGVLDVTDSAVITSEVYQRIADAVIDSAVITSAVTLAATSQLDIVDSAVITSAESIIAAQVLDVIESATIGSIVTHRVDAITDVVDEGFVSSEAVYDLTYDAWTANVVNWAMSVYKDITMTSSTERYAVSDSGLFSVADTYANMNCTTGKANMGTPQLKNVPYVYMYSKHDAPMDISVTADVNGTSHTESYKQMARVASDTRAVRCTLGRGFRSSYYELNFSSNGYARVVSCVPVVNELSRRI